MVSGGSPPSASVLAHLPAPHRIIAADHGYDHARALGLRVDVLVGDLDSVDPIAVDAAVKEGVDVRRHAPDKDATDLELALDLASESGDVADRTRVIVVSGDGTERLDHLAAQFGLLASPKYAHCAIEAWMGHAHIVVVHGGRSAGLTGRRGDLVTLLPVGGRADGVRTEGLRFPLFGETLDPFATRGVSNELIAPEATISVRSGVLLLILPDALRGA